MAEKKETIVNKIEEIDSEIESLRQEKVKLTAEHFQILLEHDLKTIQDMIVILRNLKTDYVSALLGEYDVLEPFEEIIEIIEKDLGIETDWKSW